MADMGEADYVIVGGGTAGLVVACRLSENPETRIIVLEGGEDVWSDARVQNPLAYESLAGSEMDWNLKVNSQVKRRLQPPLLADHE